MTDHDWDDEPALLEELGRALGHDPGAVPPPDRVAAIRAAAAERIGARHRGRRPRDPAGEPFAAAAVP